LSVIDLLEIVDVDKQDEEGFAGAASETEGLLSKHEEAATVVEPGEFVSEGEVVYVLLEAGDAAANRKDEAEGDERGDGGDVLRIVEASAGGSNKGKDYGEGCGETRGVAADASSKQDGEDPIFGPANECNKGEQNETCEGLRRYPATIGDDVALDAYTKVVSNF
jgi:hypothetical protein